MKLRSLSSILLIATSLVLGTTLSAREPSSGGGSNSGRGGGSDDPTTRELVKEFKDSQEALREALRAEIAKLENPTKEQIEAVIAAFKLEHAAEIEAQKELAKDIRDALKEDRPDTPRPTVSPELAALLLQFKTAQQAIRDAERALRDQLKAATDAAARETILAQFREAQKVRFDELKAIQAQIRALRGEDSGDRRSGG